MLAAAFAVRPHEQIAAAASDKGQESVVLLPARRKLFTMGQSLASGM